MRLLLSHTCFRHFLFRILHRLQHRLQVCILDNFISNFKDFKDFWWVFLCKLLPLCHLATWSSPPKGDTHSSYLWINIFDQGRLLMRFINEDLEQLLILSTDQLSDVECYLWQFLNNSIRDDEVATEFRYKRVSHWHVKVTGSSLCCSFDYEPMTTH